MSERFGPPPPDEPIIGAGYPPPSAPPPQRQQRFPLPDDSAPAYEEPYEDEEAYDDESGEDDEYYDDEYEFYEDTPARQPMFYLFIGMAALIGGLIIFLLFTLFTGGGKEEEVKPGAGFNVTIDFPTANYRVEVGKPVEVSVTASSNEPITRFELLVGDRSIDQIAANSTAVDKGFKASGRLHAQFDKRGDYDIVVRVTSSSGATKSTSALRLIAVESVGDKPTVVKGKAQTDVNVRTGPGETYELVKTLKAGDEVSIVGKTRDKEWLLIDLEGQLRWVKRSAILEQDSLDLVKTTEPTPRPEPTATNTAVPSPSPSPSRSPSPGANSPDFGLKDAILIDGGTKLRVTVQNLSANNFNGSLVVAVSGVNPGTLTLAFAVNLPANGSTTVDFPLDTPVTTQKTAKVTVDPDNAIKELNEDNNTASFGLGPPIEAPDLVIQAPVFGAGGVITITIKNSGGALPASAVTVRVTVGQSQSAQSQNIALANGQSATFPEIAKPGTGKGTVEVLVNGQVLKSLDVTIP